MPSSAAVLFASSRNFFGVLIVNVVFIPAYYFWYEFCQALSPQHICIRGCVCDTFRMNNSFAGRISYVTVALLLATGFFFPLAVLAQETVNPLVEILKNAKTNMPYETKMSSCPNLYRNLSFGSRGNNVVELQNFLIAQGDLAVGNNTGYFGRMTESAVKFQVGRGRVQDGNHRLRRCRPHAGELRCAVGGTVSSIYYPHRQQRHKPFQCHFAARATADAVILWTSAMVRPRQLGGSKQSADHAILERNVYGKTSRLSSNTVYSGRIVSGNNRL